MQDYRLDIVTDETPKDRPLSSHRLSAHNDDGAEQRARRTLKANAPDQQKQYGELFKLGSGLSADYIGVIDLLEHTR